MSVFTVEYSGRFTTTKRAVDTWPEAVAAAVDFIATSTHNLAERSRHLDFVQNAAGSGEPTLLPNGKTLEIGYIED